MENGLSLTNNYKQKPIITILSTALNKSEFLNVRQKKINIRDFENGQYNLKVQGGAACQGKTKTMYQNRIFFFISLFTVFQI